MNSSDQITALLTALLAARLAFPPITRNCEAWSPKSKKTYPYADLNAIIDATIPVLGAHGLLLVQAPEDGEAGLLCVTTTLFHVTSGQWMRSTVSVERLANPQDAGSAITYMKRYSIAALLCISTEDDDAASLNGSSKVETSAAAANGRPSEPVSMNGHSPGPEPGASLAHPTEDHIAALANLALTECHEDKEVYYQRIRTTMRLKPHASVAPRLLTRTMSMVQYMELFTYYQKLAEQLARKTPEVSHGSVSAPKTTPEPTPATAAEDTPAVPPAAAGSSSAGENGHVDTTVDPAYHKLYQEALGWGIAEPEIQHILTHHRDLTKCRTLLWKARRNELPPVWEKVPAA